MKVIFKDVEGLKARLAQLGAVIAKKSAEPTYSLLRIFTEGGQVKLSGVDIDSSLTVIVKGEAAGDVNFTVNFPKLNGLINSMSASEISVEYVEGDENYVSVSAPPKGTRKKGQSAKLKAEDTAAFMKLSMVGIISECPSLDGISIGLPGFKEQIEQVQFAISKKEGKHVPTVAKVESDETSFRLVATDGYRIAISERPANLGKFEYTISEPSLELVKKLNGENLTVYDSPATYYFVTDVELLTCGKTHGEFPPYNRVVPKNDAPKTTVVLADKAALKEALQFVRQTADPENPGVNVKTTADSLEFGSAHEESRTDKSVFRNMAEDEVPATVTGAPGSTKFDIDKAAPFFDRATFPVTLLMNEATSVLDFHANGGTPEKPVYRFLLMPMRSA